MVADEGPRRERKPPLLRVLHVEDSDGDARLLNIALGDGFRARGCEVTRVWELAEAINQLYVACFDAVLLDLNLGDATGVETVRRLREQDSDIPIVVLSGGDDQDLARETVRAGAQSFVVKGSSDCRNIAMTVLCAIERQAQERHLFEQANHDELTGLPNRRMFLDHMHHTLLRAARRQQRQAIMFIDVNGFKTVNDTLGHSVGDALLQHIASRLRLGLRASDMLARYAGDEFIVHLDSETGIDEATCRKVMERIEELFAAPIHYYGNAITSGLSIGLAFCPDHGADIDSLIRKADQAMYVAKRSGQMLAIAGADDPLPDNVIDITSHLR